MGMKMNSHKKMILSCVLTFLLIPSVLMAYPLGSDIHTYPEVLHPPLGPAGVPEASSGGDTHEHSNTSAVVVNIGYGWIRLIAPDGSSQVTCSKSENYNRGASQVVQSADTMIDLSYAVAMVGRKQPDQLSKFSFSSCQQETEARSVRPLLLASGSGSGSGASGGGCPVNYFLPPGSQKSKTQVKCQTRYDPVAGKWVTRYVVVFAMQPKNAQVQKITKNGAITYVAIDKKGHGMDVIQ